MSTTRSYDNHPHEVVVGFYTMRVPTKDTSYETYEVSAPDPGTATRMAFTEFERKHPEAMEHWCHSSKRVVEVSA